MGYIFWTFVYLEIEERCITSTVDIDRARARAANCDVRIMVILGTESIFSNAVSLI